MDAALVQIVPEGAGSKMTYGISIVVNHHLGLTVGTASEIGQHHIGVAVYADRAHKRLGTANLFVPVVKTLGHNGPHADQCLHRGTLFHGLGYLLHHIVVANADDSLDSGLAVAVDNVAAGEHMGGRYGYGAQFVEGQHSEPEFIAALKDNHHSVAAAYTQPLQVARSTVALLLHLTEGERAVLTTLAGPQQGMAIGSLLCPAIHHVVGKVEVIRHHKLQVAPVVCIVCKCCLF